MKTLTVDDLRAGARYALEHPESYDQRSWCGTSCCVLGHARALAGSDQPNDGPRVGEIEDSVIGRAMASLMHSPHADVARLIAHGDWRQDGSVVAPAGCGLIGARATVGARAWVRERATVGARAQVGADAMVGTGARVGEGERVE